MHSSLMVFSSRGCMDGGRSDISKALKGCITDEIPTCLYASNDR